MKGMLMKVCNVAYVIFFVVPLFAMQTPKTGIEKALESARAERQRAALQGVAPRSYLATLPNELLQELKPYGDHEKFLAIIDKEHSLSPKVLRYLKGRRVNNLTQKEKIDLLKFIIPELLLYPIEIPNEILALAAFRTIARDPATMGQIIELIDKHTRNFIHTAIYLTSSSGAVEWLKARIKDSKQLQESAAWVFRNALASGDNADYTILKRLIEVGMPVNTRVSLFAKLGHEMPLLMLAIQRGVKPEVIKLLLDNGAQVNLPDTEGNTALKLAREKNSDPEIINMLIARRARE